MQEIITDTNGIEDIYGINIDLTTVLNSPNDTFPVALANNVTFELTNFSSTIVETDYSSITAELLGDEGVVHFTRYNPTGQFLGEIDYGDHYYSIQGDNNGTAVIWDYEAGYEGTGSCVVEDDSESGETLCDGLINDCSEQFNILMVWHPDNCDYIFIPSASCELKAGIYALSLSYYDYPKVFANSLIPNKHVNVIFWLYDGIVESQAPDGRGRVIEELLNLRNNPDIKFKRQQRNADMVVYFSMTDFGFILGEAMSTNLNPDESYIVVRGIVATADKKIMIHETGHIWGGLHEVAADPTGTCNHAYFKGASEGYQCAVGDDCQSIMWSIYRPSGTWLGFSNPNIFSGQATRGTFAKEYNASQVSHGFCLSTGFSEKMSSNNVAVNLEFDDNCANREEGETMRTQANVSPGTQYFHASFTFAWESSISPISEFPTPDLVNFTNTNFHDIIWNSTNIDEDMYIRVWVKSSDGEILSTQKICLIGSTIPRAEENKSSDYQHVTNIEQTSIFPNPCPRGIDLNVISNENFNFLELFTSDGKITQEIHLDKGTKSYRLISNTLNRGLYFLRVNGANNNTLHKLIIQ